MVTLATIKLTAAQRLLLDAVKAGRVYRSEASFDLYGTYREDDEGHPTRVQERTLNALINADLIHIGPQKGFTRPWLAHG